MPCIVPNFPGLLKLYFYYQKPCYNPPITLYHIPTSLSPTDPYEVVIIVRSLAARFKQREHLRALIRQQRIRSSNPSGVGLVFNIVGHIDWSPQFPRRLQLQLEEESSLYKDLIIGHYKDVPRLHTIAAMRWANCAGQLKARTYLLIDDRTGVQVDQLRKFIQNLPIGQAERGYFGDVKRKCSVMGATVPWPIHNTYVRGFAFLVGREFVADVSVASAFLPGLERSNGVAIGLLALKLGYEPKQLPLVYHPHANVPENVKPTIASIRYFPVHLPNRGKWNI